jgi:hypothetical protein
MAVGAIGIGTDGLDFPESATLTGYADCHAVGMPGREMARECGPRRVPPDAEPSQIQGVAVAFSRMNCESAAEMGVEER